jgi:SOS-response transcriptional repressor LexA
MNAAPLTKRQRQILSLYEEYVTAQGMSPTLEEVANHYGLTKVTIFGHVEELVRKQYLRRDRKGTSRSIQLVTGSSHQQHNSEPLPTPDSSTYSLTLPIVGIIAAGPGIQPIENLEELDLADLIPRHADVFALKVQGTSMIEDAWSSVAMKPATAKPSWRPCPPMAKSPSNATTPKTVTSGCNLPTPAWTPSSSRAMWKSKES